VNLAQPVNMLHVSIAFAAGCAFTAVFLATHM
jgi:hypothetical protein